MLELFRCGGLGEFVTGGLNPDDTLRKAGSMPPKQISAICKCCPVAMRMLLK